jgi:hypothetical protein
VPAPYQLHTTWPYLTNRTYRENAGALEHPDTLMSINNLAATLVDLGDLVAAEDLLQQAVHAYQQFLGPEHPHTLKATSNLTWIQRALDEPAS